MIVGLGDYSGGELVVEGELHDIRYKPLEFDGWNKIHWTLPFAGPRRPPAPPGRARAERRQCGPG